MWRLFFQVMAGILSLWLAIKFVSGVEFIGKIQYLILVGGALGLLNAFLKPIIKTIAKIVTLPLRILTFGLFDIIIALAVNIGMVWLIRLAFPELIISGLTPLFWTSLIVWGISFILIKLTG